MNREHKFISSTGMEIYFWKKVYIRIQKIPKPKLLKDYAIIKTELSHDNISEFEELYKKGVLVKIKRLDIEVAKRRAIKIIESHFEW